MLLVLWRARPAFDSRAALFDTRLSPGWIAAFSRRSCASTWLGLFAFKHVEYSNELWWQFELHGEASRMLRATVGAGVTLLLFAVRAVNRLCAARGAEAHRRRHGSCRGGHRNTNRDLPVPRIPCATKPFSSTRTSPGSSCMAYGDVHGLGSGIRSVRPNRWVGSSACFWRNATATAAFQCFTRFHEIAWIGTRMWG